MIINDLYLRFKGWWNGYGVMIVPNEDDQERTSREEVTGIARDYMNATPVQQFDDIVSDDESIPDESEWVFISEAEAEPFNPHKLIPQYQDELWYQLQLDSTEKSPSNDYPQISSKYNELVTETMTKVDDQKMTDKAAFSYLDNFISVAVSRKGNQETIKWLDALEENIDAEWPSMLRSAEPLWQRIAHYFPWNR